MEKELKWRKAGGGSLYIGNRIIKPNQTFTAKRSEIPVAFLDTITCLSTDEELIEAKKSADEAVKRDASEELFELVLVEDEKLNGEWFNVVNKEDKKVINEKPMRKSTAVKLMNTLQG